jgi:peptidoglycan-N-acetylglucosamine deacetylase
VTEGTAFWIWLVGLPALFFLTAYLAYAPLTDLWSRYADRTVFKYGLTDSPHISLTFDDGPDPAYTPRVLDILAELDVPAAFFLVGAKVERHQDILRQIEAGRHLIGTHTYSHRHAYLLTPWRARREVIDGLAMADKNNRPVLFRPPWGACNLAIRLTAGGNSQRIVLWSVNGGDWKKNRSADQIVSAVTGSLKPGSVVVLHDSGGAAGAAERTLAALPHIVKWARDHEYQWVRLDQLIADSSAKEAIIS